jgi:hypothetical protein
LDSSTELQSRERALQFIAAHVLVQGCREKVASASSASRKGALRKAGFYLAGIIHARYEAEFDQAIKVAVAESPSDKVAKSLISEAKRLVDTGYSQAVSIFEQVLKTFVEKNGKDEDAALKNSDFAKNVFNVAKSAPSEAELNLTPS